MLVRADQTKLYSSAVSPTKSACMRTCLPRTPAQFLTTSPEAAKLLHFSCCQTKAAASFFKSQQLGRRPGQAVPPAALHACKLSCAPHAVLLQQAPGQLLQASCLALMWQPCVRTLQSPHAVKSLQYPCAGQAPAKPQVPRVWAPGLVPVKLKLTMLPCHAAMTSAPACTPAASGLATQRQRPARPHNQPCSCKSLLAQPTSRNPQDLPVMSNTVES